MSRTALVGLLAAVTLAALAAVALPTVAADGSASIPALVAQIQGQAGGTVAALALVDRPWVARIAGLGGGLAVGLLGGGVLAYVRGGR